MSTNTMYIYCSTSPVQVESSPRVPCGLAGLGPFSRQVPCGLAGLSPFAPPGTLRSGRTQSFRPPGTLRTGGTQSFQPPGTLWTGGTRYFLPPRHPTQPFSTQVPCGWVGLSYFSPPGTLRTESSKMTRTGESLSPEDWYWYSGDLWYVSEWFKLS